MYLSNSNSDNNHPGLVEHMSPVMALNWLSSSVPQQRVPGSLQTKQAAMGQAKSTVVGAGK
jgi:hypothetical protein